MGEKDAAAAIAAGEEGAAYSSLENMMHYHALKKTGDERIMKHTYGSFTEAKNNGEFEEYNIHEDPHMKKYTFITK